MKLNLRFFGRLSEELAHVTWPESFPGNLTVGELRDLLAARAPGDASALSTCMVAVNTDFADDGHELTEGDEVAFLPPVSGG